MYGSLISCHSWSCVSAPLGVFPWILLLVTSLVGEYYRCATKNLPSELPSCCIFTNACTNISGSFSRKFSPAVAFIKISNDLSARSI